MSVNYGRQSTSFNVTFRFEGISERTRLLSSREVEVTIFNTLQIRELRRFKVMQNDADPEPVLVSTGVYKGDRFWDTPQGVGILTYHATNVRKIYSGQFQNGSPHGLGVLSLRNGDMYLGEWVEGRKQGKGIYCWADGNVFEGTFQDDRLHRGTLRCQDGIVKQGEWRDNQFHSGTYDCLPCTIL